MEYKLVKNETLQVQGPSKIEVINGEIEIFGKRIFSSESLVLKKGKSTPIEARAASTLIINTASSENVKKINGKSISEKTIELAKEIIKLSKPCKIILLGETDTGKSSTILYLANYCFEQGNSITVFDLDVGQHDIGPPATLGYGVLRKSIYDIKEIPVDGLYFIGNNSPSGHLLRCIIGINELLEKTLKSDIVLINTTGWTSGGAARNYKTAKIELIKPDLIVALQREKEIEHLLKPFHNIYPIWKIPVSQYIYIRSMDERRFLREVSFRNYFSDSQSIVLNCNEVGFIYSLYKTGNVPDESTLKIVEEIMKIKVKYCEISRDGIFLVQPEEKYWKLDDLNILKEKFGVKHIHIIQEGDEEGILLGLVGETEHLGIGILEKINYEENKIGIYTPVNKKKIKQIQFGSIKVSKSGREIERIKQLF